MPDRSVVLVTLLATLGGGCFSNTARNIAANGDPLRVRFDHKSGTYQTQEVVGGSTYYDSNGNAVGSVERTQAVTKRWARTDTTFYQGDAPVDEQDYYHLAQNAGAVDEIKAARAQMSRDLTIGFPLAILGTTASTLAAIGTFGDSSLMRYGASTALTLVALGGAYLAVRGLKTYQQKPLLERERAIKHASVVEHCYRGDCHAEPGGAPVAAAPAPTSLAMRAKSASSWAGTWSGSGNSKMQTKDGRSTQKTTPVEIAITENGDMLTVTLEPRDTQRCTLEARIDGDRAELRAGQSCRRQERGGEVAFTLRDGSALSLRDGELQIALSLDLEFTDRSKRKPRTAKLVGSMAATATRAQ